MDGWHPRYLVVDRSVDIEQAFDLGVPCWAMSIIKVSLNWEKICKKKIIRKSYFCGTKGGLWVNVPWSGSFAFHFLISAFNNHVEQLHTFYRVKHSMWNWKVLSFHILYFSLHILERAPYFYLILRKWLKVNPYLFKSQSLVGLLKIWELILGLLTSHCSSTMLSKQRSKATYFFMFLSSSFFSCK